MGAFYFVNKLMTDWIASAPCPITVKNNVNRTRIAQQIPKCVLYWSGKILKICSRRFFMQVTPLAGVLTTKRKKSKMSHPQWHWFQKHYTRIFNKTKGNIKNFIRIFLVGLLKSSSVYMLYFYSWLVTFIYDKIANSLQTFAKWLQYICLF